MLAASAPPRSSNVGLLQEANRFEHSRLSVRQAKAILSRREESHFISAPALKASPVSEAIPVELRRSG